MRQIAFEATGAYHREVTRQMSRSGMQMTTPLMQLQDPRQTKVLIVTLAETTPVLEAARLQADLRRAGIEFQTENDTEVAAGYLAWRLREGASLEQALEGCLRDLDGFYTFAVGTADGFAVLRDPIACKPAVLAETDDWVAMSSEWRSIAVLPGAAEAEAWEPEPGVVYAWEKAAV